MLLKSENFQNIKRNITNFIINIDNLSFLLGNNFTNFDLIYIVKYKKRRTMS